MQGLGGAAHTRAFLEDKLRNVRKRAMTHVVQQSGQSQMTKIVAIGFDANSPSNLIGYMHHA